MIQWSMIEAPMMLSQLQQEQTFYEVHLCPYQTMIYYLSSYITLSLACVLSSIYVCNFPENVSTVILQHIVGYK